MAKKKKKINKIHIPVIGKYIDTPTKAEVGVIFFIDDIREYKLSGGGLPSVTLKSCRFQLRVAEVKRKKKFYNKLQPLIALSDARDLDQPQSAYQIPLSFGLLKLRKNKKRQFVLIQSANQFYASDLINVLAVVVDNLLYVDLVNKLKNSLEK